MKTEGSLLCSHKPATGPYNEAYESSPHLSLSTTTHSNIIPSSTPTSSKWKERPFRFSDQNVVCISSLSHACYIPTPPIILYLMTLIIFGEEYKSCRFSLCNFLQSPTASSLLCTHTLLSIPFSNTFSPCSSFSVRDQISHSYKMTGMYI